MVEDERLPLECQAVLGGFVYRRTEPFWPSCQCGSTAVCLCRHSQHCTVSITVPRLLWICTDAFTQGYSQPS